MRETVRLEDREKERVVVETEDRVAHQVEGLLERRRGPGRSKGGMNKLKVTTA